MKVLLHVCCAPCSVMVVEALRQAGHEVTFFWYNPNIHPTTEYVSRRDQLRTYAKELGIDVIEVDHYGLSAFVSQAIQDLDNRCLQCYEDRLLRTALTAKANQFDCFQSTLFISPYQRHDDLKRVAEMVAEKVGIAFHYQDFRPLFREGQTRAREMAFYMQKYCGCIFSESERYRKKWGNHQEKS
ncbi:MAG: epoxyqueuosine reductase QueH [Candidatus Izemoplasmatales bacterium]